MTHIYESQNETTDVFLGEQLTSENSQVLNFFIRLVLSGKILSRELIVVQTMIRKEVGTPSQSDCSKVTTKAGSQKLRTYFIGRQLLNSLIEINERIK